MKQILLTILFIPSLLFAELTGYFEVGKDIYSNVSYTEIQIGYNFNVFDFTIMPYGNQKTWAELNEQTGSPYRDIYTFGSEIRYKKLTLDVSHFCSHYVYSGRTQFEEYQETRNTTEFTKISIRYTF